MWHMHYTFSMPSCIPYVAIFCSSFQPTEEQIEQSNDKRTEAMMAANEGNIDEAINIYTEAIKLNPVSAILYAKRARLVSK